MFAAGQCVFACLRKIQIVKYESPGGRYVPTGLWVYARHDVCLPCLLMLSTSDLRNWGRTYSLVPSFQNSDRQANASVEIIV